MFKVLHREENKVENKPLYIANFVIHHLRTTANLDLLGLINNEVLISDETKKYFEDMINNYGSYDRIPSHYDEIKNFDPTELSIIYLLTKKLETQLQSEGRKR